MKSGRKLPKRCKGHIKNCGAANARSFSLWPGPSSNGLRLAKPWRDSSRYDVVVETGGHFVRVQMKSTANRQPNGGYVYGFHPSPNRNSTSGEALISWQLA
jgi:hypothetical protein